MATPYVMAKVPTSYYPCDADLPDCCKDASKGRYSYWCSSCKVDPVIGGGGGGARCCNVAANPQTRRQRSLSETAELADPLREQNRTYHPAPPPPTVSEQWAKRTIKDYDDAAATAHGCTGYQPSLRPYDTEYVEEKVEHGRLCPSKRLKERLLPFSAAAAEYEPEVLTTPGAAAAAAAAAAASFRAGQPDFALSAQQPQRRIERSSCARLQPNTRRRRSASHSPENHSPPRGSPPPPARAAWDSSPPPPSHPIPPLPSLSNGATPGGSGCCCCSSSTKYRCMGQPPARMGAGAGSRGGGELAGSGCGRVSPGRRNGPTCGTPPPARGKRRSMSRSSVPANIPPTVSPSAIRQQKLQHSQQTQHRSLSPPACLSAGHAAAAAAAKASLHQYHVHRKHHQSRTNGYVPSIGPSGKRLSQTLRHLQNAKSSQQAFSASGCGEPYQNQHPVVSSQLQQELRGSYGKSEKEHQRERDLRQCVPVTAPAGAVRTVVVPVENKRLRQRSESDPGNHHNHGGLGSAAVAAAAVKAAADAVKRLQQVVVTAASTTGAVAAAAGMPLPAAAHALLSPQGGGGVVACEVREAKRARDVSPVCSEPPPLQSPHATANLLVPSPTTVLAAAYSEKYVQQPRQLSPPRIVGHKAYHKNISSIRALHRCDSSESDYDDQTPVSGAIVDCKDNLAEESEEDDARSVMSSLTTASSSDSASPSLVGETLGSISLSDTGLSSKVLTPRAPIKPLTPPRPPIITTSYTVRRRGNFPHSLRSSLFSHVPPFIRFSMHDAKGDPLPPEVGALLKWKLSTITPVVVRRTLVNSGFRLVRKSNEWTGTWGKHMKSLCFRTLKEFQKINHFPGTFQIGRKDRLWKNLYRLMTKFGRKEFGFIPRTYVLPQDSKLLRQAWEKNCGREKWIIKPPASARGTGIKVIHRWAQIPKKRPLVVQKYIGDPYLINGSKFDLRLYVLVTSMNPMRVYIYDDGLVRFASVKYSGDMATLSDRYMHLTNYSINKLSSMYTQNEDATACQGHKWTVKTLWSYMEKLGVDVQRLWDNLVDLCIKTVISGEPSISQLTRSNLPSRYCSYELFGIDVLLDEHLKPWLLEVNISPSLHSASPLDLAVKGPLVRDLMNLAGYHVPNKLLASQVEELLSQFGVPRDRVSSLCFDRRLYTTLLSPEERQKHHSFQAYTEREEYLYDILDRLTPDDVRHLIQAEDELTQAGRFIRIFPTPETHLYLEFFESPSYYNRLFDAWEAKYHTNRQDGIERLEFLCQKKHHLSVPPVNATAKFSANQQALHVEGEVQDMGVGSQKTSTEDMNTTERKVLTLSSVALYRAARPRSGKVGVVLKPFPRSSYISRKPRTSAPAIPSGGGGGGDAPDDSPPPQRPRPRARVRRISSDSPDTPPAPDSPSLPAPAGADTPPLLAPKALAEGAPCPC